LNICKTILFAALFAGSVFASPVSECGALRTENGNVVCSNGNPAQLRGMSLFWNQWTEGGQYYNASTVNTLANTWKSSVVRAAIGDGNTNDAITIINAAINAGIYVIVDWHKHNIDVNGAKTFFTTISQNVKNRGNPPNVIYEIFNEPTEAQNGTWANIKSYAEQVIPVIRANSPDNLIIVGTPDYSARVDLVRDNPLAGTNAKNVAYAFHFYASTHAAAHRGYVDKAWCAKLPLFVTEWGTSEADGNGTIKWDLVKIWVDFIEARKLSWANWSISSKSETSSTKPEANTATGQYMINLIQKLNSGQSHQDVTSSPYVCPENGSPQQGGGGAVVGQDMQLEAENYHALDNSSAQKVDDQTALGGKVYLGTLNSGSKATYLLTATKDTLVMLQLRVKSSTGAVVEISNGTYSAEANTGISNSWNTMSIPMTLHPTGQITLTVKSGSIDIDYIAWRAFNKGDPLANPPTIGDYENFPQAANWDPTPIIKSLAIKSFAVYSVQGGVLLENIPNNSMVNVFDIKGKVAYKSAANGELRLSLTRGTYIISVNGETSKVVVK
jgi:endoglucanase